MSDNRECTHSGEPSQGSQPPHSTDAALEIQRTPDSILTDTSGDEVGKRALAELLEREIVQLRRAA